jgi:hypothetical protein
LFDAEKRPLDRFDPEKRRDANPETRPRAANRALTEDERNFERERRRRSRSRGRR